MWGEIMEKEERNEKGFEIYVESMAKSADDKTGRIIPILRRALENQKGDILDMGAGGGELTQALLLVAKEFDVKVFALDRNPRMIKILKEKFKKEKKAKILKADIENFKPKKKFAAVVCCSIMHEIFSEEKNIEDVKSTLRNIYNCLLPGGIIIIRDGVKPTPENDMVLLQPLKKELLERFQKILNFTGTQWTKIQDCHNLNRIRVFLAISKENAYELAVKYQYPEINWPIELKEKFGFWTKEEAKSILEEIGFEVVKLESYLLPYFAQMFAKDFKIFKWQDGPACVAEATSARRRPGAVEIPYFDTHLIIAAQKEKRG